jgi:hypothetical protein
MALGITIFCDDDLGEIIWSPDCVTGHGLFQCHSLVARHRQSVNEANASAQKLRLVFSAIGKKKISRNRYSSSSIQVSHRK